MSASSGCAKMVGTVCCWMSLCSRIKREAAAEDIAGAEPWLQNSRQPIFLARFVENWCVGRQWGEPCGIAPIF